MNLSATTQKSARLILDMIKNSQSAKAMRLIALYVARQCARFIALLVSRLKGLASIVRTIGSTPRRLTWAFTNVLGCSGTLSARAPQRAHCEPLKRRARGVAFVIGISLSIPMQVVDAGVTHAYTSKDYIRSLLPKDEALCLIKLYGKESAFKTDAIGNLSGAIQTYGIPQLKNPLIANMSNYNQIDYGIKYIRHRAQYGGSMCKAYQHWVDKGWH